MNAIGKLFALAVIIIVGCAQSEIIAPTPRPTTTTDTTFIEEKVTTKSGLGMSTNTSLGVWYKNIVNLKSHWYYTWGTSIPSDQEQNMPLNAEFVPMLWGAGSVTDATIEKLKQMKEDGQIKYVLGFNEPDLAAESNMTVEQALALWPRLEEIGVPLVSPATAYPSLTEGSWMTRFMDGVEAQGLRVDHIAIHLYVGSDPATYLSAIKAVYEKYQKPIWITEFAVRDDNTGGDITKNRFSPLDILSFMQKLLPELEKLDYVYRYAWFNPSPTMAGLYPCALIDGNGKLTILGDYYKSLSPNQLIEVAP